MIKINDSKKESVVQEEDINNKKEDKKTTSDNKKIIIFLDKEGCKENPFSPKKRFFSYDKEMLNSIPITYSNNKEIVILTKVLKLLIAQIIKIMM